MTIQGVHHRHCKITQRADGYGYSILVKNSHALHGVAIPPSPEGRGISQRSV